MSLERLLDRTGAGGDPAGLYVDPAFPPSPKGRPHIYFNMVATVDGKTLLGPRGTTAKGLGGPTDHLLMRRLQQCADAVLVGAQTVRVSNLVYPAELRRAVLTRGGDLPLDNRLFTDAPGRAIVFAPEGIAPARRAAIEAAALLRTVPGGEVDVRQVARVLADEFGVQHLLVEGGPSVNAAFLAAGLVDEFFITVAPRLKGGATRPTVVDGEGLPGTEFASLTLVSAYADGDELYLRYRCAGRGAV